MNKEKVKGIVIGFLIATILSSGLVAAANHRAMREVIYGVRVNLNGQLLHFDSDMLPFVMENRTFLSVRAISEALDLPADFDANTNTVYLGNRFAGQTRPLTQAAPHFDTGGLNSVAGFGSINIWTPASVSMSGVQYQNPLMFGTSLSHHAGGGPHSPFTLHNLDGQFRMLTGYVGRADGTDMHNATINFFGDGELLQSYSLNAADMPTPISVFVEGVRQLRIQVVFANHNASRSVHYGLVAFLE